MYIHANINRTQASKENYLLLSSLLVSLLWGLCRVRYSGWALLSTPRALETRLEMRNEERFLSFFRGKTHLVFLYNSPLDYISRTIEEKYLVPSSRIYSRGIQSVEEEEFNSWKTFNLLVTRCYFAAMFAKRWRWFRHSIEAFFFVRDSCAYCGYIKNSNRIRVDNFPLRHPLQRNERDIFPVHVVEQNLPALLVITDSFLRNFDGLESCASVSSCWVHG